MNLSVSRLSYHPRALGEGRAEGKGLEEEYSTDMPETLTILVRDDTPRHIAMVETTLTRKDDMSPKLAGFDLRAVDDIVKPSKHCALKARETA
jgi:hypothetical protein